MLIYQVENGTTNNGKSPLGGVIVQSSVASSMLDAIANPITYYANPVINQAGYSGDLYNYYWTSYSRGTDGTYNNTLWHNAYLDGYIPLRVKSIYDPCPYLYRIPSNGTWNQFRSNPGWTWNSYLGGVSWNLNTLGESWFVGLGMRDQAQATLWWTGQWVGCRASTIGGNYASYAFEINAVGEIRCNRYDMPHSRGTSVRCIEGFNVTFVAPKGISMQQMRAARR